MMGSSRGIALVLGLLALVFTGAAQAQENLDAGKTPAQLFASDCAICHKTTRGLARSGGMFGLESFLREHYTASRESAAKIAGYLRQVDHGPKPSDRRRAAHPQHHEPKAAKQSGKPSETKTDQKKTEQKKTGEKKSGVPKASEKKPEEAKPAEQKPAEAKPDEKKPAQIKATDSKPSKPKAMEAEARAAKPKPSGKPDAKPGAKPSAKPSAKPDKPKTEKPAQ